MKIYQVLLFVHLFWVACSATNSTDENTQAPKMQAPEQQEELLALGQTTQVLAEGQQVLPNATPRLRLVKIKRDGLLDEKFKYDQQGRLVEWIAEERKKFFYNQQGNIAKIEIWDGGLDREELYAYTAGQLNQVKRFELEDKKRVLIERADVKLDAQGRLAELKEYDLSFDENELVVHSVFRYNSSGNLVEVHNYNDAGELYQKISITPSGLLHPYAYLKLPTQVYDLEIFNTTANVLVDTELLSRNAKISEKWEFSANEDGVVTKGVLTLPRRAKKVVYQYIYKTI